MAGLVSIGPFEFVQLPRMKFCGIRKLGAVDLMAPLFFRSVEWQMGLIPACTENAWGQARVRALGRGGVSAACCRVFFTRVETPVLTQGAVSIRSHRFP